MRTICLTLVGVFVLFVPSAYGRQSPGVRVGVSGDPSQFVVGAHVETAPLAEDLTFRPNVEIGVGHGLTIIGFNFEFAYWIQVPERPWRVYVGAGPAAVIVDRHADGRGRDGASLGGGFNVLLGVEHPRGLFGELKVGAIDSPSVKFLVGHTFR